MVAHVQHTIARIKTSFKTFFIQVELCSISWPVAPNYPHSTSQPGRCSYIQCNFPSCSFKTSFIQPFFLLPVFPPTLTYLTLSPQPISTL